MTSPTDPINDQNQEFTTDDVQPEIPTGPGNGQVAFIPWSFQFAFDTNPQNGQQFIVLITEEQNHTSQYVGDIPTFIKFLQQLQGTIQQAANQAPQIVTATPADVQGIAALDAQLRGQRRDGIPPHLLPWNRS